MDYVISASYGNDSMAMIRWAYERGLKTGRPSRMRYAPRLSPAI
jgi:hypothetical protein